MRLFKSLKNPKKTDAKLPKKSSGLNNRAAIGIDIDQHSIKMVQLSGRSLNQIQLEKYVIAKLPKNIIQGNKVQNYDQLVTYLQQAYAKLGTSCKNIIASVPQNLATIEQLTYTDKDAELDLQGFVESSISEVSSISLEEANYDYQVLSQSAAGEAVLAVASRKDEIEPLIDAFNAAGMKLSALDVDIFGQYNAYALWINHFAPRACSRKSRHFRRICRTDLRLGHPRRKNPIQTGNLRQRRTAQPTHPAHLSGNRRKSGRNHQLPAKTFRLPRKRGKLFQPADYPRNTKGLAVLLHHADRRRYDRHQAYPADRGSGAPGRYRPNRRLTNQCRCTMRPSRALFCGQPQNRQTTIRT